jgi:hypothetical protein
MGLILFCIYCILNAKKYLLNICRVQKGDFSIYDIGLCIFLILLKSLLSGKLEKKK